MGAYRTLCNPMLRRVETVMNYPKHALRRKLGEARRDSRLMFDHVSAHATRDERDDHYASIGEAREDHPTGRLFEHVYRPTKGWLTLRA